MDVKGFEYWSGQSWNKAFRDMGDKKYLDTIFTKWVGTKNGGLNKYDDESGAFIAYYGNETEGNDLRHLNLTSIWADHSGKIWIGTSGDGLRIFDKKTGKFVAYKNNPYDQDSISDNNITSIYQDSSGIMWVATLRGGVNKSLNYQMKFNHFKHNPDNPQSIRQNSVYSICCDRSGILWVGTSGGLDKIDEKNGLITHFSHNSADPGSISAGGVRAVMEDEAGIIWVGMNKTGLSRFNSGTGSFTHYKSLKGTENGLSNNTINVIHQDKKDNRTDHIITANHKLTKCSYNLTYILCSLMTMR
jgi:ligand-binding sensor domain-containing protein